MRKATLQGIRASAVTRCSGRYYPARIRDSFCRMQSQREAVCQAVRRLIRQHRATSACAEPRERDRIDFAHPVAVRTEDGRILSHVGRELSNTGIRLLGAQPLLGKMVRIHISQPEPGEQFDFVVRILWTFAVADDLFENGGPFLEVAR